MNPEISIIIPTYNRAEWLPSTLASIQNQTFSRWECIIVDDLSTDQTIELVTKIAENDSRIKVYKRPLDKIKGPNSCRNYGFEKCTGAFVYFFDSDDLLKSDALEKYLYAFKEDVDVVVAPVNKTKYRTGEILSVSKIQSQQLIFDYFKGDVSFYICGPFWRKAFLLKQSELFDEELRNLDDFDFNLRMLYSRPKISYLQEPLVNYQQHESSLKQELKKLNVPEIKSAFAAREKHYQLIKTNSITPLEPIQNLIISFRKELLRLALIEKHDRSFDFYQAVVSEQLKFGKYVGIIRTSFAYLLYKLTGKGYRFLK